MAKSGQSQINLTQSIEEQESRANRVVFEFARHKLQGGPGGNFQQPSSKRTSLKNASSFVRLKWWALCLRDENLIDNRLKFLGPANQRIRVAPGELGKGLAGAIQIRPPLILQKFRWHF